MIFFFMQNYMSNEKLISFYCGCVQTWFLGNIGSHLGDISQVTRKPRLANLLLGPDSSNPKKKRDLDRVNRGRVVFFFKNNFKKMNPIFINYKKLFIYMHS